jgi:membrane-bound metal-dependent hydrolase YbcI (DUF457 family)
MGFVAAAFPDSDVVLRFISETAYLRGHRGVTHSLLMLPLWSLLLGWLAARAFRRPDAMRRYAWLAASAIAIHIAGDWITQFGTMLLAPLSDARFGLGAIFIIDLVISGILVAGLITSALWRRSRVPALIALALLPAWVALAWSGKQDAIRIGAEHAQREGRDLRDAPLELGHPLGLAAREVALLEPAGVRVVLGLGLFMRGALDRGGVGGLRGDERRLELGEQLGAQARLERRRCHRARHRALSPRRR